MSDCVPILRRFTLYLCCCAVLVALRLWGLRSDPQIIEIGMHIYYIVCILHGVGGVLHESLIISDW